MTDTLLACRDCGQLHHAQDTLLSAYRLTCVRCGGNLSRRPLGGLDPPLALATTAFILLLLANTYPIFVVNLAGRHGEDLVISGALQLIDVGGAFAGLGILVGLLSFAVPTVCLTLVVIVLAGLKWGDPGLRRRLAPLWKAARMLYPWSMLDVYLLGTYVAFTRLSTAVDTTIGVGGYALAALVLAQSMLLQMLGRGQVWDVIADPRPYAPRPGEPWIMCDTCRLVVAAPAGGRGSAAPLCPRCIGTLHPRRPGSLSTTLALGTAAAILYIPANLLPILTVVRFGRVSTNTILSGVRELALLGMWPLAALVFFASIVLPMLKLVSLGWFLVAIRRRSAHLLRARTALFRTIHFIGRWSNIDVFMASILITLLQFGALTTVAPEPGLISFAAVVALTMLATAMFDPRLMWDAARDRPAGDRPAGDRPAGDRPAGDRPAGDRPAGDRPAGDRPAGDRPAGAGR